MLTKINAGFPNLKWLILISVPHIQYDHQAPCVQSMSSVKKNFFDKLQRFRDLEKPPIQVHGPHVHREVTKKGGAAPDIKPDAKMKRWCRELAKKAFQACPRGCLGQAVSQPAKMHREAALHTMQIFWHR
ncbi:hypothetical protein NLG97_g7986 [Lecanicillium saksenae]|uniref:Uncharacterized protein n=1 Tax=Lecanicillium saksenae TaxID=468837 RepID=A0ACC1QKS8_9HYPO|nr:hypothetical protein NLG97_g7986 [Lecanicillium saksenae]